MTQRAKTTAASTAGSFAPHERSESEATLVAQPIHTIHDGTEEWRLGGKLHREDGPAAQYDGGVANGGTEQWFLDGRLHREDGPAVTTSDGPQRWFRHGIEYFPSSRA